MRITKGQFGLAAVILLAPGGFILGATLVANHYRKRRIAGGETRSRVPSEPPIVS